jgi:apolipoprotein D and lipocalin family protein
MLDILLAAATLAAALLPNRPIQQLDVLRYMGTWHEIARLPQKFQKQCVADVTATYKLQTNGHVEVTNACRKADGSMSIAIGEAKPTTQAQGALKVRFAPKILSWLGAVWGDYWIIELDPDYRWVVIGGSNQNYLWILARTPTLDADVLQGLKARAAARGYDVGKLIYSSYNALQ